MAKKKAAKKKATRKKAGSARKRLTPRKEQQGIALDRMPLALDAPEVRALVADVEAAGGAGLGAYREPLSGRPLVVAALPREAVDPTPFQRDLSPTHTKRLAQKIEESGSYLDPIIVVRGSEGGFCGSTGSAASQKNAQKGGQLMGKKITRPRQSGLLATCDHRTTRTSPDCGGWTT